jgi:hypothetical protein
VKSNTGGWSATGPLITRSLAARAAKTGSTGKNALVNCQDNLKVAMCITVQINTDAPPGCDPQAMITFSVEGNTDVVRRVSVGQGTAVTGIADSFDVEVRDFTIAAPEGLPYEVDISVAPGVRGCTQNPPTLTGLLETVVPASGSVILQVPVENGIISALVSANSMTAAPPIVDVAQFAGGLRLFTYNPLDLPGFVPFQNIPKELVITNKDPVNSVAISVLFGIEG